MTDPRFNSIHLEPCPDRRQEYRRAREALLHSRGQHTVCAERDNHDSGGFPVTIIQEADVHANCLYWLQDAEDCIYPLKAGVNTVGRSEDNDVVVADQYVSRRHCAVVVHMQTGCELHDTASKNGTFVNGARLAGSAHLRAGDEIRMCGQHFVFRTQGDNLASGPNTLTLSA